MKRCLAVILSMLFFCGLCPMTVFATADDGFVIRDGVLLDYTGSASVVAIPDGVTSIGSKAFAYCETMQELIIPDSVTEVGKYAFFGCSRLQKVRLSDNLQKLSEGMFGSTALKQIEIPAAVTEIGASCFSRCNALTAITIPDTVTKMGEACFSNCKNLTKVSLPDSILALQTRSFQGCSKLEEIVFPDSITAIGSYCLAECSELSSVTLPKNLVKIPDGMFSACTSLKEIEIPESVTAIGCMAFNYCIGLTELKLPENVSFIMDSAFSACENLAKIDIPTSVNRIGWSAFFKTPWLAERLKEDEGLIVNHILIENIKPYYRDRTVYLPEGIIACSCETVRKAKYLVIPPTVSDLEYFGYADVVEYKAIYGEKGSYAESYAKEMGSRFVPLALKRQNVIMTKGQTRHLQFNSGSTAVWKSSNPKVAVVDQNGKITAKATGTATITATLYGKAYTCKVIVSAKTYTVQRGDTLWGIAAKELGSGYRYKEIMEMNGLTSTLIHRGKKLYLPV